MESVQAFSCVTSCFWVFSFISVTRLSHTFLNPFPVQWGHVAQKNQSVSVCGVFTCSFTEAKRLLVVAVAVLLLESSGTP